MKTILKILRIYIIFIALIILLPSLCESQIKTYGKIYPFDDSKSDKSFSEFVSNLKLAIQNKDKDFIYNILDDSITVSFGDPFGILGFKEIWNLENPETDFWKVFSKIVNLGFVTCKECENTAFIFPYYWDHPLLKGFECDVFIIVKPQINVYESKNNKSNVLGQLSYDIIMPTYAGDSWYEIEIGENKKGYIKNNNDDYCDICGLRGGFEYKKGKWKLTWFVEGD